MNLTIRLVIFLCILKISTTTAKDPPTLAKNTGTPLKKGFLLLSGVFLSSLLAALLFDGLNVMIVIPGNAVVFFPVLIGVVSLGAGICCQLLPFFKKMSLESRQLIVVLPLILNLVLIPAFFSTDKGDFYYQYGLGLLFFLVVGSLFIGILDRLQIAPIPKFLQGLPIQLTSLFLIFLSLSFFKGIFFNELF